MRINCHQKYQAYVQSSDIQIVFEFCDVHTLIPLHHISSFLHITPSMLLTHSSNMSIIPTHFNPPSIPLMPLRTNPQKGNKKQPRY